MAELKRALWLLGYAIFHQAGDTLDFLGLRWWACPICHKRTYLPHGGWFSQWFDGDNSHRRRWMCKWCGYYVDERGYDLAVVHPSRKTWVLASELSTVERADAKTMKEIYERLKKKFEEAPK